MRTPWFRRWAPLTVAVVSCIGVASGFDSCAGNDDTGSPPDASSPDGGTVDAGVPDAGSLDSGERDSGVRDAGPVDGGAPDSGSRVTDAGAAETVGGGSKTSPAVGPAPAYAVGDSGFVLVKNWDFGTTGTITNNDDLKTNFQFHDQFGTIGNGTNYGAKMVAVDQASALTGQPIEDPAHPVRSYSSDSMKTYLVPLGDAGIATPTAHNVGSGSFQAKWTLPTAGSRLGEDLLWETRVRYVTPPYFWFAIWASGNQWNKGAEFDIIESFGYDNGGGNTNFDGRYWHSNAVPSSIFDAHAYSNWHNDMTLVGFPTFDATQWHTWSLLYRADDSYSFYCDGIEVQYGTAYPWTLSASTTGVALDINFLFDATWGHTQIASVNKPLPFSAFDSVYYEWDYSRIYLR